MVDKNGFLLAIMVTVAHIHDSKAVVWLMRILQNSYASIQTILADGGNQGGYNRNCNIEIRMLFKRVMRKDSNKGSFKPIHKRWIVERTFSWFDKDRSLCRNYELLMESAEEIVKLSAVKLLLNKF